MPRAREDGQVVFIEGLFGSGKSTTAELLERELGADGRQVVSWYEFAEGHPIPIDPERVEQEVLDPDPIARVEAKWDVAKLRAGSGTLVLESRLFQHAAMYPLLADQPASAIKGLLSRLYTRLVPLKPRLVFFSHGDIAARVESVCAAPERRSWLDWASPLSRPVYPGRAIVGCRVRLAGAPSCSTGASCWKNWLRTVPSRSSFFAMPGAIVLRA